MANAIRFSNNGREFEIRASLVAGDWQIWIHEHGRHVHLYTVVPYGEPFGMTFVPMVQTSRLDRHTAIEPPQMADRRCT